LLIGFIWPAVNYLIEKDQLRPANSEIPVDLNDSETSFEVMRYIGLISLGFGDTFAGLGGEKLGSFRPKFLKGKSFEGTFFYIIMSILSGFVYLQEQ